MPITKTISGKDGKPIEITVSDDERQPCEIWSRVMGYLRPTTDYNIGKRSEFRDRLFFKPNDQSQLQLP